MNVHKCIDTIGPLAKPGWESVFPRTHRVRIASLNAIIALFDRLVEWQQLARQRRELRKFSDRELKDIGLSRADAEREGTKPFWRK